MVSGETLARKGSAQSLLGMSMGLTGISTNCKHLEGISREFDKSAVLAVMTHSLVRLFQVDGHKLD